MFLHRPLEFQFRPSGSSPADQVQFCDCHFGQLVTHRGCMQDRTNGLTQGKQVRLRIEGRRRR